MSPKLKVGLLLYDVSVPYWASRTVDRIVRSDHSEIAALLMLGAERDGLDEEHGGDSLLYKAYHRLDRAMNAPSAPDPLARERLPPGLEGIREMRLDADLCTRALTADAVRRVQELGLDILVSFDDGRKARAIADLCHYGGLSFSPGSGEAYDGRYTGLWEIYHGTQTVSSHVKRTYRGSSAIVYRSWSRTVMRSVGRNREQVYYKGISFIPRVLESIHALGADALEPVEGAAVAGDGPARPPPGNLAMMRFFLKRAPKSFAFLARRAFFEQRWAVRYALEEEVPRSFEDLMILMPPKHTWWGDPQAARQDDDLYIFIEELALPHSKNDGRISVIKLKPDGGHEGPVPVLERPYHLSYPFVFEWKGSHYMVPESSNNRTIELYEAEEFPYRWKFIKDIMSNVEAVDTTIVRRNGLWWLFTNMRENEGGPINDELFLFHSDDLLGDDWVPHPLNPVITDARSARPAGRIFEIDGVLYRPSQDCSKCYGYAVNINRIQELDERRYGELSSTLIRPEMFKGASRVHTFSHIHGLTAVDTYMARPRPFR